MTAIIGPSGCGKSTFLRSINRLNDLIPGTRHDGDILVEGVSVFSPSTDLGGAAATGRHGVPAPESVPEVDLRQRGLRRHAQPPGAASATCPTSSERCLRQAALWDEVKDRLDTPGAGPVRRPAAAALHRAGARQPARGAADGRALLGPRPDRDPAGRGADVRPEEALHDRDRDPQHAAGGAGVRLHGILRLGATGRVRRDRARSSPRPPDERTEAYITGRFG